ncbi:MAG: 3-oxoacyl-ACP synthase III family protein [Candidatus Binatia bacterium]
MSTAILALAHELPAARAVGPVARPIAAAPGGPSDLALGPARRALSAAGLEVGDIDLVMFATMTPDVTFPGAACFLQHKLGCGTTAALDVRGQCAGFLTALMMADAFVSAGQYRHVLLAAGEVHSSGLDYSERGRAVAELYGDGAAAAVLGAGNGSVVESIVCHTDGRHYDRFWIEYPSSRQHPLRVTVEDLRAGRHYVRIDREHVAAFAHEHLPAVVRAALSQAGRAAENIDAFVLSHVLPEVVEHCAAALAIPKARLIDAGARHGHLTAAGLPVALSEAVANGRLAPGARVCVATCGAGYAWGAAVLRL